LALIRTAAANKKWVMLTSALEALVKNTKKVTFVLKKAYFIF
jgi:hypothetical protein